MDMKNLKKAFGMYKKQKEKQKEEMNKIIKKNLDEHKKEMELYYGCLLYTSPSPRDGLLSRMPSSA